MDSSNIAIALNFNAHGRAAVALGCIKSYIHHHTPRWIMLRSSCCTQTKMATRRQDVEKWNKLGRFVYFFTWNLLICLTTWSAKGDQKNITIPHTGCSELPILSLSSAPFPFWSKKFLWFQIMTFVPLRECPLWSDFGLFWTRWAPFKVLVPGSTKNLCGQPTTKYKENYVMFLRFVQKAGFLPIMEPISRPIKKPSEEEHWNHQTDQHQATNHQSLHTLSTWSKVV